MNKSKYVFLILACIYVGIAIGGLFSVITINSNVLLGLSFSSLFIALADAINNHSSIKMLTNDYNYSLQIASDYLQSRIDAGNVTVGNFDVCNIKCSIDALKDALKTKKIPVHPNEFEKAKMFKYYNALSIGLFVIGIASFVVIPFSQAREDSSLSTYITISAFATMCLNIFCDDKKDEMQRDKQLFENDKVNLIAAIFPDFMFEYNNRTQHLTSYTELMKRMQETTQNLQRIMNEGVGNGSNGKKP